MGEAASLELRGRFNCPRDSLSVCGARPLHGAPYRARAGITNFRFHDLRHTAASYMAQAGINQATIMAALGHTTLAATQRYVHLGVNDVAAATRKAMEGKLTP